MGTAQKTYSLKLPEFNRYLVDKVNELRACYQETEEIQFQFNDIFKKELAAWQEKFEFCFPRVLTQRHDLPPALAQSIDKAEQEETAKLNQEMADLEKKTSEDQLQSDSLLRKGQEATAALRQANPELNAKEEETKAQLMRYEDEYAQNYEQIEKLEGGLGFLTKGGQIAKLKRRQHRIKDEQTLLMVQLRNVRKAWQDQIKQIGETQSELRQQWEALNVTLSQEQARHDFVANNIAGLAQQQAITRVLSDLDTPPGVEGELGQALDDLVERNKVRRAYEVGLRSVAEALGLTKGVADGLERFGKSVAGVVEEQQRFTLKDVSVELPQWVINVAETWKPLRERVKDEKYLGTHPLEFSQIIKSFISDRITDDIIKQFFETMGDALNTATKAWS